MSLNNITINKVYASESKHKYTPFTTIQSKFGSSNNSANKIGKADLVYEVTEVIVPNIVNKILEVFPVFEYLDSSSIGVVFDIIDNINH